MPAARPDAVTVWRRTAVLALLLLLALCLLGGCQTFAWDVGETCTLVEGQTFDLGFWAAHRSDSLLPPYSSPCNADFDRVPGWLNPAIAVTAGACAVAATGHAACRLVARRRTAHPPRR
ncbi:hypothetical protein SAMN05660690_4386 [Geodermatophilus telluris]|uniref:Lipoprotein n=1 Tax=Geodermatophilus telluris TaxID=1190417 RepID=A0A1G6V9V3_9ACTN|nr:hypothetical protein [Geodermatophilus telluris]SDD49797.1 hypothetical protein SAMN05660690_4386 [Geodermatophilus telluris]